MSSDDAEPELTETQKAYNVAQSELFQLAAYGHCVYHPAGEMATDRGKRQHERYRDLIRAAQARFEAAALRKAADAMADPEQLSGLGWESAQSMLLRRADQIDQEAAE
jgi:hypothetical protein